VLNLASVFFCVLNVFAVILCGVRGDRYRGPQHQKPGF
jgi:hypothetical protein